MSISALETWVKSHGGSWSSNVAFEKVGPNNVGAVFLPGPENSPISIRIPAKAIIKLSDAVTSLGSQFDEICRQTRNVNAVTKLFLARERLENRLLTSLFGPYIEMLPGSKEINSPYVWSPADLECLKGTNLGSSLRENIKEIVEEWWLVVSVLPESLEKPTSHFVDLKFYYEHSYYSANDLHEYVTQVDNNSWTSFPAYLWAAMIFKSRSFPSYLLKECGAPVHELDLLQEDVAMLIPMVDLLNHNPQAQVTWGGEDGSFVLATSEPYASGDQVYNNYGQKGNEELLLAHGFCLENNAADTVALKIKVPAELLPELEKNGVQLPSISDYTTSIVRLSANSQNSSTPAAEAADGLLFFISKERVPENLIQVFQWLVRSRWEQKLTVRMQLSGLNHLRQALESKSTLIDAGKASGSANELAIRTYLKSQKSLLDGGVKFIKRLEKAVLAENKTKLLSLKSVYKRDVRFAQSLLVTMGVTSYDDILLEQLLDQVWLLYLIRCFNRKEYVKSSEGEDDVYLPQWIADCFARMDKETEISAGEVLQFKELYENLILPMNQAVPEIYNVGSWTVRELIVSSKVLDTIGFVRGREQECILVNDFE